MKLSIREKWMLIILAVIAVTALGINYLVMPQYRETQALAADMVSVKLQQVTASADAAAAGKVDGAVSRALVQTNKDAAALLPTLDSEVLNVWFLNMAKGRSLTVSSIGFGGATATDIAVTVTSAQAAVKGAAPPAQDYILEHYADLVRGTSSGGKVASSSQAGKASSSPAAASSSRSSSSAAAKSAPVAAKYPVLGEEVTLHLTGSYGNLKGFLDDIAGSRRLVRVTAFNCGGSGANVGATVTIDCFAAKKPDDTDKLFIWQLPAPAGQSDLIR